MCTFNWYLVFFIIIGNTKSIYSWYYLIGNVLVNGDASLKEINIHFLQLEFASVCF